jgi:hypothetical protein
LADRHTLTPQDIFDTPMSSKVLEHTLNRTEIDERLRELPVHFSRALLAVDERHRAIFRSKASALWYLFWVGSLFLRSQT